MEKYIIGSVCAWDVTEKSASQTGEMIFSKKEIVEVVIHGVNCPKKNFGQMYDIKGCKVNPKPDNKGRIVLDGHLYCGRCGELL